MPKQVAKRFYLAGPMSGIAKFNFPAFDDAALLLRRRGISIVSPAEMDDKKTRAAALRSRTGKPNGRTSNGHTWGDFLSRDVKLIADKVDGIIFLPGWSKSRGARLEAYVGLLCKHQFHLYAGNGSVTRLHPTAIMAVLARETETLYGPEVL